MDTRDVIVFEGTSAAQLRKEFEFSVDDYLKVCEERGRTPDKPFSGKIPLRIPPEVQVNAWITETVEEAAGKTVG